MRRKHSPLLKIILVVFCLALLGAVAFLAVNADRKAKEEVVAEAGSAVHGVAKQTELTWNAESAPLKKHTETVLLLGIDKDGGMPVFEQGKKAPFYNYHQADVIVLLCIDNDAKTVTPIQINRDTMMDVPWLDVLGNYGGTQFEQICLAFNSGSGRNDSCENTADAVRKLLFDAPVDHYLAFTMGGISTLNDLVGGVTVKIEDDLTPADPTLVQGTTVTLKGNQAENFIRARMALENDTNLARMRRHRDYFEGFMKSARKMFNSDSQFMLKAVEKLQPYMVTDLTAEAMSDLVTKLDKYEVNPVLHAEGELKIGEFYEFYVDEDDLWGIVKKALCITEG